MSVGEKLLKKISKKYEASTMVYIKFQKYDVALKTDDDGNPILMFIGNKTEEGTIKGDRYARRLMKDSKGNIVKDHWDFKGKV